MRFRNSEESLSKIGAQLGVAKLIEGSIFRVNDRVRINVQLVDAIADEYIWSATFEEDVKDVMLLQNEVAAAIAEQVEVELTPQDETQLENTRPVNPAAYEAFLKGQFYVERFTAEDMQRAAQWYQKALELDPLNPFLQGLYGAQLMMINEHQKSVDVIERLMESAPGFGFGHIVTWQAYHELGETEKAIDWYEIAYERRDPDAPYIGVLTKSEPVHSHPRFINLLREMGLDYWVDKYSQ